MLLLLLTSPNIAYGIYASAAEQGATYVERLESSIYLGGYKAKPITELDDLPANIKAKLKAHLIKRLGHDFFQRLSVSGGQMVDYDELYRIDPGAKRYKWEVFAFRIGFRISDPEKGIKQFNGYIELSQDGSVLREIEFPSVAKAPWKGTFVRFASALETAQKLGVVPNRSEIKYSRQDDVLMFVIQEWMPRDAVSGTIRVISINAHTGQLMSDDRNLYIR